MKHIKILFVSVYLGILNSSNFDTRMAPVVNKLLNTIDGMKKNLDSKRPLATDVAKTIHEDIKLLWTYNTNAIEGNCFTLKKLLVYLR